MEKHKCPFGRNGEHMKKAVRIILTLSVVAVALTFGISAVSQSGDYKIKEVDGKYVLEAMYDGYVEIGSYYSLDDCFEKMSAPTSIRFEDVSTDKPAELPRGDYTVTGKLQCGGTLSVPKGCKVEFSSLSLTFVGDALLRIKGGSLTVNSSDISSCGGVLVRLDYSSSSSLVMNSGVISGEYEGALIDIASGSVHVLGGSITNKCGTAIKNDGELALANSPAISGVPYSIALESPMHLSVGEIKYRSSAELKVKYDAEFRNGTLTEVFYGADEESVSDIRLYGADGKEVAVTQFDETRHTSEKCFAGVYLPYTVRFYVDGALVCEQELLYGERVCEYVPDTKEGYAFGGWYTDADLTDPYAFDKGVCSDFNLFAGLELAPPSFSVSSLDFEYDGEDHVLTFDKLTHPVSGGYYTYKWYKDGAEISSLASLKMRNVSDSGIYSCEVSYILDGKTASFYATNIKVSIKPKEISPPEITSAEYTGDMLFPSLSETSHYTVNQNGGVGVGRYAQSLVLKDKENTVWSGAEGEEYVVYFEITRAQNVWIEEPQAFDSYFGCPLKSNAISKFGEVIYLYSATRDGTYKTDIPIGAGSYFVKAVVVGTSDYTELTSEPLSFSIIPESVVGIKLLSPPLKTEYFAFEKLDATGMSVTAIYNSGRESAVGAAGLRLIYSDGTSLRVGDGTVIAEYEGASLLIPVTVKPLSYDISSLGISDFEVTFDGAYHTLPDSPQVILGKDGIPLKYTVSGGGAASGSYTLSVDFFTESRDYTVPASTSVIMTVLPRTVVLSWSNSNFVYDGKSKLPSAFFVDVLGVKRTVKVRGANVYAGENYLAEALSYSSDYVYENPTCSYSVSKADYDISAVTWSSSELTYTGKYAEVTVSGLPDGVGVVGYTDNRAINVGEYLATVSLSYDSQNYNAPTVEPHGWKITKADYDLSSFSFSDAEYVFDGNVKYPAISGLMPIGEDGFELKYSFSDGALNASEGWKAVTLTFFTESKNYNVPTQITAKVRVIPKSICVLWSNNDFTYDGNPHAPAAISSVAEISVTGEGINAGKYIATASSANPNYSVSNATVEYEIVKAANFWIEYPSVSDFYESLTPNPSARAYSGEPIFKYYTDSNLTSEAQTLSHGKYYMVASVPESENYLPLTGEPIEVTSIEVIAVGIDAEINSSPTAFCVLSSEDYDVWLLYNDGSRARVTDGITVAYKNGPSFRYRDEYVGFSYGDFSVDVPVSVQKAKYDLSAICWDAFEITYDGEPHAPTLLNIPDGITLLGYSTNAKIRAGVYTFSALISYDDENYEEPILPVCTFEILKAPVPVPTNMEYEYSATSIDPPSSELYSPKYNGDIRNSGTYSVTYELIDKDNYVFENGCDSCECTLTVIPRSIDVCVSDFDLYLFESEDEISPTYVLSDSPIGTDTLDLYFYLDGDDVYIASVNPNYSLNVRCGKLNRLPYPNESTRRKIILGTITVLSILVFIFFIYKKRDDVADVFCMAKAKRKNRAYIGYLDNGDECKATEPVIKVYDTPYENYDVKTHGNETEKDSFAETSTQSKTVPDTKGNVSLVPEDEARKENATLEYAEDKSDRYCIDVEERTDPEAYEESDVACDFDFSDGAENCNSFEKENMISSYYPSIEEDGYDESDGAGGSFSEYGSGETFSESNKNACPSEESAENEPRITVKMEEAESMLTDSMAKDMIKNEREIVYTEGKSRSVVNVDTLSRNFVAEDRVDVNVLKEKSLVPYDTGYIKVLARGAIDKPLKVYANDFSLSAVKMILLSGGETRRVTTVNKQKGKRYKRKKNGNR